MRGIVRVEGTAVPFLSDYEINVHVTVVIFTTLIIAGVVFLVFSSVDTTKSFEPIITEQNSGKNPETSAGSRNETEEAPVAAFFDKIVVDSCEKLSSFSAECEKAVSLSLERYPGKLMYIEGAEGVSSVWIIGIELTDGLQIGNKTTASKIRVEVSGNVITLVGAVE